MRLLGLESEVFAVCVFPATGEPPLCTTYSALSALRQAVAEARKDAGHIDWTQLGEGGTARKTRAIALILQHAVASCDSYLRSIALCILVAWHCNYEAVVLPGNSSQ